MFAKMKGFVKSFMCLAASLLLASCTYRDLKAVERTMETDPVIADSLLAAFSMPERGRSQALYALLKTQIDYKMYRDADSDSLIRVATDYYGRKYKGYHAAMAWYSLGCISAELGNDSTAADAYLSALSLFPDTLVRYYALAEQNLGRHYEKRRMYDEAYKMFISCAANAERLADTSTMIYAKYQSGLSYLYAEKIENATLIFDSLLADSTYLSVWQNILLQKAKISIYTNDFTSAINYAKSFINNASDKSTIGAAYSILGDAYNNLCLNDSAIFFYNKSLQCEDELYTLCSNAKMLTKLSISSNHTDDAAQYFDKYLYLNDSISKIENQDILIRLKNAHELDIEWLKMRSRNRLFLTICISILIIAVTFIQFAISNKKKKNELFLEKKQNNLLQLQNEIATEKSQLQSESIKYLEEKVLQMTSDNIKAKDILLQVQKQKIPSEKMLFQRTSGYDILLHVINDPTFSVSKNEMQIILNDLTNCFSELIAYSHLVFSEISIRDIHILILSEYHVNYEQIAAILGGITAEGIRKKKYRLKKDHPTFCSIFTLD